MDRDPLHKIDISLFPNGAIKVASLTSYVMDRDPLRKTDIPLFPNGAIKVATLTPRSSP